MKKTYFLLLIVSAFMLPLNASSPPDIVGLWITPENKSIIQIELRGETYTGKILRINPCLYVKGVAPKDIHNMDSALRSRSLEGLTILSGITYDRSKKRWNIERIYEPERGKYYEGYIIVDSRAELSMRGHVAGKKWLGKTEEWRRVEGTYTF